MDVKSLKKKKVPGLVIRAREHTVTLGMFCLFFVGIISGALMIRLENPISSLIVSMFRQYNGLIVANGFIKNFAELFFSNVFFVLVLFFLGFSAIGSPFVCIISFVKGVGIGIVSSYLYNNYMLSGFGYCMLIFFPQQIINMLALFIAMNESFVNSKMIFKTIGGTNQNEFDLKIYSQRYFFVFILEVISSLLGSVLNTYLSPVFIK